MATLYGLPNEILSRILANFCVHCCDPPQTPAAFSLIGATLGQQREEEGGRQLPPGDLSDRQALYSMCLVSTRFRDVAQGILFHAFVPGSSGSSTSPECSWGRCLTRFLRTVVRCPDLAAQVQMVVLGPNMSSPMDRETKLVLEEVACARGFQLADLFRPSYQKFPPGALELRELFRCDGLFTMILAYLPNLVRLVFECYRSPYYLDESCLRTARISTLSLRTLEVFGCQWYCSSSLMVLLKMTSSTLRTLGIVSGGSAELQTLAPFLVHDLRHLCLTDFKARGSELALILSRCEGLESFIFDAGTFSVHCPSMMPRMST